VYFNHIISILWWVKIKKKNYLWLIYLT